jgi:cell division protein FtsL
VVRFLSLLAFGFLAGLVVLIYNMKFETRRLEARATQLQRAIEDEKDNVALMRTEWSHVTRPERVEKLTREVLDLQPVKSTQLVSQQEFTDALAQRPSVPVAASGAEGVAAQGDGWQARDEIGDLIRKGNGKDEIGALIRGGGRANALSTTAR